MGSSAFEQLSGAGAGIKATVNQPGHNFVAGDVLRHDGSLWTKAQADSSCNSEALGIVESVAGSSFTIVFAGQISTAGMSGLAVGRVYFLSTGTPGALTDSAPTATGTVKKTMLVTTTSQIGIVVNYIGSMNGIQATNIVELNEVTPVGSIMPWSGKNETDVPIGWLLCDGDQFSSSDYPELSSLLGDTFGPIYGALYRLPDFRGKGPIGVNKDNSAYSDRTIGDVGGEEKHFLTQSEIPSHAHTAKYEAFIDELANDATRAQTIDGLPYGPKEGNSIGSSAYTGVDDGVHGAGPDTCSGFNTWGPVVSNDWHNYCNNPTVGDDNDAGRGYKNVIVENEGGGLAHNNMQPFIAINWIIRASSQANAALIDVNLIELADVDITQKTDSDDCVWRTCNVARHADVLVYDKTRANFVSTHRSNENYILNGNFDFWQRGRSASDMEYRTYLADRFSYYRQGNSRHTMEQKDAMIPTSWLESGDVSPAQKCLKITTTSVHRPGSGGIDYSGLQYHVEGYDWRRLFASGSMTLSFWTKSNVVGKYSVTFRNKNWTRSYASTYTITQADTWQKVIMTVPTPIWDSAAWAGGWHNEAGLRIWWGMSSTPTYLAPEALENTWQEANLLGIEGQVNCGANVGDYWYLGQVKLEEGTVWTPYRQMNFEEEITKLERYYEKSYLLGDVPGTVSWMGCRTVDDWIISPTAHFNMPFRTRKNNIPTVTAYNPSTGQKDGFHSVHYENGSDLNHNVKNIYSSDTNIHAMQRYRVDGGHNEPGGTTLVAGYRNKISFHYTAEAEIP